MLSSLGRRSRSTTQANVWVWLVAMLLGLALGLVLRQSNPTAWIFTFFILSAGSIALLQQTLP